MSAVDATRQHEPTDIVLQIPAIASSLRVVRMVAATIVADGGFDVDEVDDVRMAVDELCAAVIETRPTTPLRVSFRLHTHVLEVEVDADGAPADVSAPIDDLREAVLGAVTDHYRVAVESGRSLASFTKRSVTAASGVGQPTA
jgi:serine/threonine-protein kinase RsbW